MILEIIIGFAGGVAVGAGFVAFITVLGLIPRLILMTRMKPPAGETAVVAGALAGVFLSGMSPAVSGLEVALPIIGLSQGVFIGMLAAALTEVLNVFPLLFKRIQVEDYLFALMYALVFGKVAGSLFHWVIFTP
ncbi:stage V sporulation protein AB [Salimicrobium halophilum]|uniref:Stage V sporulation protein AB n=1 Tax=Salimicrobium halophilum TaxID=86666 RepID=A0A1G8PXG0_9BACI|nr:stage V sporulation protein AB [Salimicrobium halophilum]SDI97172.1 stage V sporulation protein AB [Salimicrobium halophilum]